MTGKDGRYAWTAKIGEKGQLVIPKEARELFDLHPGDTVLLLGDIRQGLALVNSKRLIEFTDAILQAKPEEDDQ